MKAKVIEIVEAKLREANGMVEADRTKVQIYGSGGMVGGTTRQHLLDLSIAHRVEMGACLEWVEAQDD